MSDNHSSYEISLGPVGDIGALAPVWRDLESRSAASFFQSWNWIGTLLTNLEDAVPVDLLMVRRDGEIVGLALLIAAQQTRHRVIGARSRHLNETGRSRFDCLTIEYNGIVADHRHVADVVPAAFAWLVGNRPEWDELYAGGLDAATAAAYRRIADALGLRTLLRDRKRADYVDLAAVRAGSASYIERLSRNTRHQIRRSIRLYEDAGPLVLTAATSTEQSLAYLDALKALHQPYWEARGQPGAFASRFFETFHRDLIRRCFDAGHIQIVRVAAGEREIGYIYNFVAGTIVYQYQSGFCYDDDPKLKPGLVSHYLAIVHNLENSADIYDFLAGESQHKTSLGTDAAEMDWLVLQRNRLKFRIENCLRDAKHRLAARRAT